MASTEAENEIKNAYHHVIYADSLNVRVCAAPSESLKIHVHVYRNAKSSKYDVNYRYTLNTV